jgi:hypothetical protein
MKTRTYDRVLATLESWLLPWAVFDYRTSGHGSGSRIVELAMIDHRGHTLIHGLIDQESEIPAPNDRTILCPPVTRRFAVALGA